MKKFCIALCLVLSCIICACDDDGGGNEGGGSSTPSILMVFYSDENGPLELALEDLGYVYDTHDSASAIDWDTIDFSPYDIVIFAFNGGLFQDTDLQAVADSVVNAGKKAIFFGGSHDLGFATGVNTHLVGCDTVDFTWDLTASPHFTVVNSTHPLADGLPTTQDIVTENARRYQMIPIDTSIETIARNGEGIPTYFLKRYDGGGKLIWFTYASGGSFWVNIPDFHISDYLLLKRVLKNSIEY
ncbi:MAG TPA: hypothetical protein PK573_03775 [Spirochaetota bacterium]|nr:hypothetical protein [Spirochaetota bacterium]HRZ26962.1 hypothetical protein [Spirochaetota bacterium]HSA15977.1 hypothetical protein [Spirochaetota bacterium]